MAQLQPDYFINQYVWTFATLIVIVYFLGTFILPLYTHTNVARIYITKL